MTHGPDGHEFSYSRAGSASSRMMPEDLPTQALKSARILHVSGISQAISDSAADAVFAAIRTVKEAGGLVSYDTNLRLKLWPIDRARAVIHAAMSMSDIALPGYEDAVQLCQKTDPDDIVDFFLRLGAKTVALTLGSEGTLVATSDKRQRVAAMPVEAVDATAAGDTFDGAFLAQLLDGATPFEAARYGNAAAALSTQVFGAVAQMPNRSAVDAFLAAQ